MHRKVLQTGCNWMSLLYESRHYNGDHRISFHTNRHNTNDTIIRTRWSCHHSDGLFPSEPNHIQPIQTQFLS
jgi:hypothetical protein